MILALLHLHLFLTRSGLNGGTIKCLACLADHETLLKLPLYDVFGLTEITGAFGAGAMTLEDIIH